MPMAIDCIVYCDIYVLTLCSLTDFLPRRKGPSFLSQLGEGGTCHLQQLACGERDALYRDLCTLSLNLSIYLSIYFIFFPCLSLYISIIPPGALLCAAMRLLSVPR